MKESDFKMYCPKCGECCFKGSPIILPEEIDSIIKAGFQKKQFYKGSDGLYEVRKPKDSKCLFLVIGKGCLLEEKGVKPIDCRFFPFQLVPNREKPEEMWISVAEDCPITSPLDKDVLKHLYPLFEEAKKVMIPAFRGYGLAYRRRCIKMGYKIFGN